MHAHAESYFAREPVSSEWRRKIEQRARTDLEYGQLLRWYDEWAVPRGYSPYRVELRIFDTSIRVCGSIDALFRHATSGEIIMVDWKRSKGIVRYGFSRNVLPEPDAQGCLYTWTPGVAVPFYAERCSAPVAEHWACNYTKYWLQQLMYKAIIERNTPLRIAAMYLVVCHPRQGKRFDLIPLAPNDELIERVWADRLTSVEADASDDDFTAASDRQGRR
jgi:hypothetical protein